jgi:hypothetical protein
VGSSRPYAAPLRQSHNWSLNAEHCWRSEDLIQLQLSSWPPNTTCFIFPSVDRDGKHPRAFQTLEIREHEPSHRYCKKMVVGWSPCIISWKSNTLQISDIISPQDLTRKIHYILNSEKILDKGTGNIIVKLVTYSWFPCVR